MEPETNDFLSPDDAASLLGVSRKTVYRYIRRGLLDAKWCGGYRITRHEVARCAAQLGRNKRERGTIE